jgi:hypothetical protein
MSCRRWIAAATAVGAVAAGAVGSASAAVPKSMVGNWTYTSPSKVIWHLRINAGGSFTAQARGTGITGVIAVTANTARFTKRTGCPVSARVGAYSYNIVKKTLTFARADDPCTAMRRALVGGRFSKVS